MTNNHDAGWDSDGSLSWEDFFGTSTDLVPTLLGMYDSLIGRGGGGEVGAGGSPRSRPRATPPPHPHRPMLQPSSPRPLSISSIASSSSSASSSGASSCSGGRLGAGGGGRGGGGGGGRVEASCAYLASIESLDDASDEEEEEEEREGRRMKTVDGGGGGGGKKASHAGSGDSGRCSPGARGDAALPFAHRVVAEVLDSERLYVRDLRQVVQGYLHCWRSQPDCPVSDQQLADLFSNIEEIYEFNSGFLERLEACGLDPASVARCFVQHTPGFCIYTHYCTHYPRTVGVLTELMRVESASRAFRERQGALAHALPLGSFLLKPVQRILKYHLLLQNMLKHMEEGAGGRGDVGRALASMTDLAQRINSMKRRHEHAVRVQEIQSLLYGWEGEDLTTFGELCAEGAFRMAGAKALRHAFLFDRMLLITKQKAEGVLTYKAHILCSNLMLIESVPGEPLSFHVIPFDNPRLQYTLRARNLEQKREWALQLKRVILENYNAVIPSHARRLVMELGQQQHRTDDEILAAEKTPPRRQHSAPEYLEKRKQERERRKSEVGLRQRLRRARKSDAGLCPSEASSPTSQRRHRRASSSSRERSHSRDGLRSVSPAAIKERFGSWRRKSEPGVYSSKGESCASNSTSLTLLPEGPPPSSNFLQVVDSREGTPLPQPQQRSAVAESPPPSPVPSQQQREPPPPAAGSSTACRTDAEPSVGGGGDQQQRSLEEIVGALLLQNRDFQKALRRQQRRQQSRNNSSSSSQQQQLRSGVETSDTDTEADDGAYEALTLPHVLTTPPPLRPHAALNGQRGCGASSSDVEDADYVTLTVPSRAQHRRSGDYDNLQQIWESVRAQQEEIRRLAEREGVGEEEEEEDGNRSLPCVSLRRAQSFCAAAAASTPPAHRPTPAPASLEALDCSSSSCVPPPTAPAVWLRQQGAHLATPSKKSGSLPRSFQLAHSFGATAAAILAGTGRPFTIAASSSSDPPCDINFEDIERYMAQAVSGAGGAAGAAGGGPSRGFPLASPGAGAGDTTEDESLPEAPTPAASLQDISVHPQHKIYRPASARASLRQVVVSVGARLTSSLRSGSAEALDDTSSAEGGAAADGSRRTSRRLVAALRHYGKTRLRLKSLGGGGEVHHSPPPPQPQPPPPPPPQPQPPASSAAAASSPPGVQPPLPIYKQGSSRLGARIALCSSDYADPRQVLTGLPPPQRPDSVLSASSSVFTSSSDEQRQPSFPLPSNSHPPPPPPTSPPPPPPPLHHTNGHREDAPLSDGSADSYYERSFEAIEALLENDVFRDSAVFSDHEDNADAPAVILKPHPPLQSSPFPRSKVPPPVPAKPDTLKCRFIHVTDVKEKSRVLAETAALSVAVRNSMRVSQLSQQQQHQHQLPPPAALPASCEVEGDDNGSMQQKGWVKHVIGKLQGPTAETAEGMRNAAKRMTASPVFSEVTDSG